MGVWEEQTKRTTQNKQVWSDSQEFSFIEALLNATNEEEVKAAYVREFDLLVKTPERHDLQVGKILFEFKYAVKLDDLESTAKVVAQAVYYIYRLFIKGRLDEVEYLVVADKDEARFFRVAEFQLFYESNEYQWNTFRASSPDPKLVEAIKNSKILESSRVYRLTAEDDVHLFSSRLYNVLPSANTTQKQTQKLNLSKTRFSPIKFGLILILSSTIVMSGWQYINYFKQNNPTRK